MTSRHRLLVVLAAVTHRRRRAPDSKEQLTSMQRRPGPDHEDLGGIPRPVLAASALAKPDPAAPRPENALDRAIGAAERRNRDLMAEAGFYQWEIDLLAPTFAEADAEAIWPVFKQEVSARNRQEA